MPSKTVTVAEYLSKAIDMSSLTQREIATAVGYPKPNVISMMRMGQTKVPIDKIPALAKALGVDPQHFTRLAMREYMPAVWAAIEQSFGSSITERERAFLDVIREEDPEGELKLDADLETLIRDAIRASLT